MLLSFATKQAQKSPYSAVTIGALVYGGERGIDKYQAEACYLVLRTAFGAQNATHLVMVIKLKLAKKSAGPPSAPKMQRILSNHEGSHPPVAGKKNPPHLRCEGCFLAEKEGFSSTN